MLRRKLYWTAPRASNFTVFWNNRRLIGSYLYSLVLAWGLFLKRFPPLVLSRVRSVVPSSVALMLFSQLGSSGSGNRDRETSFIQNLTTRGQQATEPHITNWQDSQFRVGGFWAAFSAFANPRYILTVSISVLSRNLEWFLQLIKIEYKFYLALFIWQCQRQGGGCIRRLVLELSLNLKIPWQSGFRFTREATDTTWAFGQTKIASLMRQMKNPKRKLITSILWSTLVSNIPDTCSW